MSAEAEEIAGAAMPATASAPAMPTPTPTHVDVPGTEVVPMAINVEKTTEAAEVQAEKGGGEKRKAPEAEAVKEGDKEDGQKEGRRQMSTRSEMWNHFDKIKVDGVVRQGKCKYCKSDINAHPVINGTSAMRKHFNICKKNPHRNLGDDKQAILQVTNGDSVHAWKFDADAIRAAFDEMIIEDELPFVFGEKSGFKKFMSVACPRFSIPSRRTCTRDIVRIYFSQKAKLKKFIRENCERVCLTTDCWTSQQQESYMTVTAHFISKEWKLHKKVIAFFKVNGHKGDDIGKHLQKTLIDWGIEKLMTITVDNASSNDGGIAYMRKEMKKANTNCIGNGKYLHMRCAAHIVNLIVSDGLKEVELSVKRMYEEDKGPKMWDAVNTCLRELFEEYRVNYSPNMSSEAAPSEETKASGGRASMMKSLIAKKMRLNNGGSSSSKSELDKYLAEEPEEDAAKFDILAWWKINSSRFPILACLARDVLAIPISTVASKSAFSTSGRVLDDFRTSLTPFMVEALVCTQDWLRHSTPINIAENTEELAKLEQELLAEHKEKQKLKNIAKSQANKSATTAKKIEV